VEILNAFVIIGVVVFLSGLIAYLGDRIGMKMGKKRVSLLGLRPRYSSIIITIITGILIAVLSITVLLGVYSELRQALFNINDVLNRLEYLNQQLSKRDQELTSLQEEIASKEKEISEKEKIIEEKDQQIAEKDAEIAETEAELKELAANRQELQNRVEELSSQRANLEEQVSNLEEQIATLESDYNDLREIANQLQAGVIYYMGEDIVYQKGDVIYTDVLEGGQSEQKTISELNQYLQEANKVALEKDIQVNDETGMALRLQTEDILNAARIIYNMDPGSKVIVSLVARVNVPKNDWLYANFQLNQDFIVFKAGTLITSKEINAGQSNQAIEDELESILKEVNEKAINQGLLPDNSGQVGSINFSQFYDILNQIKAAEGQVKVSIYAGDNIWREDRLTNNLRFELEEIKNNE